MKRRVKRGRGRRGIRRGDLSGLGGRQMLGSEIIQHGSAYGRQTRSSRYKRANVQYVPFGIYLVVQKLLSI